MNAKQVCVLSYWSTRGGTRGVADLALHPDSTHFAGHLKNILDINAAGKFYMADVPMWDAETETRVIRPLPINLPHEYFAASASSHPEQWNPALFDPADMPAALLKHPVYAAHGGKAVPLGFHSDGVPFTKKDTFICIYMSNGLTQSRTLLCVTKKIGSLPMWLPRLLYDGLHTSGSGVVIQRSRLREMARDRPS